jgi:hypothetical protein
LLPDTLKVKLDELANLPISSPAKDIIGAILRAASNPQSEDIRTVIKTLPQERRKNVERTVKAISRVTSSVMRRGKAGIMNLSDDEWEKLQSDG